MGLDFSRGSSMGNTPQAGSGYSAEKNEIEVVEQYDWRTCPEITGV